MTDFALIFSYWYPFVWHTIQGLLAADDSSVQYHLASVGKVVTVIVMSDNTLVHHLRHSHHTNQLEHERLFQYSTNIFPFRHFV